MAEPPAKQKANKIIELIKSQLSENQLRSLTKDQLLKLVTEAAKGGAETGANAVIEEWNRMQGPTALAGPGRLWGVTLDDSWINIAERQQKPESIKITKKTIEELKKFGIAGDTDVSKLNTMGVVGGFQAHLRKQGKTLGQIAEYGAQLKNIINQNVFEDLNTNFVPQNMVTHYEKKNIGTEAGYNFKNMRVSKILQYPTYKAFHKGIFTAIQSMEDLELRAYVAVRLFTGLRDPDVINMMVEPVHAGTEELQRNPWLLHNAVSHDMDGAPSFSEADYRVMEGIDVSDKEIEAFRKKYPDKPLDFKINDPKPFLDDLTRRVGAISNKGHRKNYDLGQYVFEILRELRDEAISEGRDTLFTWESKHEGVKRKYATVVGDLRARANDHIRTVLDEMRAVIIETDRNTGMSKVKPFTMGDLRKNIFDILEEYYGAEAGNRVLGHSIKGDVGLEHYKVTREDRVSKLTSSQDKFFQFFADTLGISSPRALLIAMGMNKAAANVPESFLGASAFQQQADKVAIEHAKTGAEVNEIVASTSRDVAQMQRLVGEATDLNKEMTNLGIPDSTTTNQQQLEMFPGDDDTRTGLQEEWDNLTGTADEEVKPTKSAAKTEQGYNHLNINDESRQSLSALREAALEAGKDSPQWADWQSSLKEQTAIGNGNTKKGLKFAKTIAKGAGIGAAALTAFKFLPWVGGVAAATLGPGKDWATDASASRERGESSDYWDFALKNPLYTAGRGAQMAEEVVSPGPTTYDLEQFQKAAPQRKKTYAEVQERLQQPQASQLSPSSGFLPFREMQEAGGYEEFARKHPLPNLMSGPEEDKESLESSYEGFKGSFLR